MEDDATVTHTHHTSTKPSPRWVQSGAGGMRKAGWALNDCTARQCQDTASASFI